LKEIKVGEVVYHEGEPASAFYIVVSGRFEAYVGSSQKKEVLAYLKQGGYFGEMSLISQEPHSASVRSRSDSLVLEITHEHFKHIVEHNASVSLEISRVLSTRLRAEAKKSETGKRRLFRSDVVAIYSMHKQSNQTSFILKKERI